MNKKPVANEGKMDKAVEAIDSAKSAMDSVRGSRSDTNSAIVENKTDGSGSTDGSGGTPATINNESTLFVNSRTAFEISSSDDATKVDYIEYKVNEGDYQKYTGPIFLPVEGVSKIAYRAVDKAGNKEATKVLTVTVDNTPPTVLARPVEKLYVVENTKLANRNNTYEIIAEDKASGVSKIFYSLDNGAKQEFTKGQPIKIEKGGPHTLKFTAVDTVGNESSEGTYVVNIDDSKPTVQIVESTPLLVIDGKSYAKKGTTFAVQAQDADSNVNKILVKIDGAAEFSNYAEAISFDTKGEHVIEAKAVDNVGNESDIAKLTVLVDVVPPTTIIKAVTNAAPAPAKKP
jgi:hypothetical protein